MLWIVCGAMLCTLSFTVLNDENDVQNHVAGRIQSTTATEDRALQETPVLNPIVMKSVGDTSSSDDEKDESDWVRSDESTVRKI